MTQKTIRFYDSSIDIIAREFLSRHKDYGFQSEREVMINALIYFKEHVTNSEKKVQEINHEELANYVVKRLLESGIVCLDRNPQETQVKCKTDQIDKALNFINSIGG